MKEYTVNITNTGIPVVVLKHSTSGDFSEKQTEGGFLGFGKKTLNKFVNFWVRGKDTDFVKDDVLTVYNANGTIDMTSTCGAKLRGNTSQEYPKKPFAIKLTGDNKILNMPAHKRWVLLANWMDRTLMRNDVAFEIARRTMTWAPRGKFVELYLNGKHQGNYYLCEQIKVDENRVDVGDDGYIFEFDTYGPSDEINYFYSPVKNYPVTIKEPDEDEITSWDHPRFLEAQDCIGNVEQLLESDKSKHARWTEITELIDVTSYIDWWIVHELTFNYEPNHPKSCYMHNKGNGKLCAGPVWDFDWGTFRKGVEYMIVNESLWSVSYTHLTLPTILLV